MNPSLSFWSSLAGLLATEATLVVAVAWLAARWLRSPQMQRAVWQAALLGVALLWVAELAGARGQLARWLPAERPRRTLSVRVLDAPRIEPVPETITKSITEPFLVGPAEAPLPTVTPPRPVWWPGWLWLAGLALLTGRLALSRAWLMGCVWRSRGGDPGVGGRVSVLECARLAAAFVRRTSARTSTVPVRSPQAVSPLRSATELQDADAGSSALDDTGAMVARLRRPLGLRRVRLLMWPRLRGPVAFGVLRPTVALPEDFRTRFSPAQCEAMLAHELAHLAARDPLWLTLADLVCALAWWHPAVWWARRQLRSACESAADEAAALVPDGRAALAESLVTFGRELASPGWARGIGVAGDGLKSQLARRVKVLLHASGGWCAVRPARMWATRFGATGVVAALVLAPWPGINGAGLAPLLAAVKAVETVSPRATNTTETLPYVREHVEPGHPEIRVTDYLVPVHDSGNQSVKFPLPDPSHSDAANVLGLFDHMDLELKGGRRTVGFLEGRQRAAASGPILPTFMETLQVEPHNSVYVPLRAADEDAAQTLIQAGVRLMEARQFDSADARLRAALSLAPSNALASHYLALNRANRDTPLPSSQLKPKPVSTGRDRISTKLQEIVLPEVNLTPGTLGEAVRQLQELARRHDPEKRGMNLLVDADNPVPSIDPTTGQPFADRPDLDKTLVQLNGVLHDVTLGAALSALTSAAATPVAWSVEDHAVVFHRLVIVSLYTREFRLRSGGQREAFHKELASFHSAGRTSEAFHKELARFQTPGRTNW